MIDPTRKKKAWMNLQEHQMPHMKGMELGKRYHVQMEIEPTELSTGENEWNNGKTSEYEPGMEKATVSAAPMTGKFKVHSIKHVDSKPVKKSTGAATGRYKAKK